MHSCKPRWHPVQESFSISEHQIGFRERGLFEKGPFQKNPFSRDSRALPRTLLRTLLPIKPIARHLLRTLLRTFSKAVSRTLLRTLLRRGCCTPLLVCALSRRSWEPGHQQPSGPENPDFENAETKNSSVQSGFRAAIRVPIKI